jgi:hypothetical protein
MMHVNVSSDWRQRPPPAEFLRITLSGWQISLPGEAVAPALMRELAGVPDAGERAVLERAALPSPAGPLLRGAYRFIDPGQRQNT